MIIAIDGPAASGKGTLGKKLAAHYNLRHLDTGLIYRAVAKALVDRGQRPHDTKAAIAAAKALDPSGFRPDLLARIAGTTITLPGLSERFEDIREIIRSR